MLEEAADTIMLHADPLEQEAWAQGDLRRGEWNGSAGSLWWSMGVSSSLMTAIEGGFYMQAFKTRMQQLEDCAARLQIAGIAQRVEWCG